MAKRHCSLIISLLFLNPISCLNAGEDVVYSIHHFDRTGSKTISQGYITDEQCQLFIDTTPQLFFYRELPENAIVFGLLAIIKNKELIAIPIYSWKEKKNWIAKSTVYCGYQFEDDSGGMLMSRVRKCNEQQYLEEKQVFSLNKNPLIIRYYYSKKFLKSLVRRIKVGTPTPCHYRVK